jgi:hypothetical protein
MNSSEIILATSIAPRGIELARQAVDTWLKSGFHVISINSSDEFPIIKDNFSSIDVHDAGVVESEFTDRSLVGINHTFEILKNYPHPFVGLINSDIQFRNGKALYDTLSTEARESMIVGSRTDVEDYNQEVGDIYELGFDYFVLDRKLLDIFPPSPFLFGAPWWDLWMPSVAAFKGVTLKKILDPVAIHKKHYSVWENDQGWNNFAPPFFEHLYRIADHRMDKSRMVQNINDNDLWGYITRAVTNQMFASIWHSMVKTNFVSDLMDPAGEYSKQDLKAIKTASQFFTWQAISKSIPAMVLDMAENIKVCDRD